MIAVLTLAGCGSSSGTHSGGGSTASATSQTTPQVNTAKIAACQKVGNDLKSVGRDLTAMQAAMNNNGDTVGAATKVTQDVDASKPDLAQLRSRVTPAQQAIVDQESSVFSQYATGAQEVSAHNVQRGLESVLSANSGQQSFNQHAKQLCNASS